MSRIVNLHDNVFSKKNVELFEKNIMLLAVIGFIIHLLLIFIENYYSLDIFSSRTNLSSNPLSALYTRFSFILVYDAFFLKKRYRANLQFYSYSTIYNIYAVMNRIEIYLIVL